MFDSELSLEGFDIYRHDRGTSGEGVAIYIEDTMSNHEREDIHDHNLKIIVIEVPSKSCIFVASRTEHE